MAKRRKPDRPVRVLNSSNELVYSARGLKRNRFVGALNSLHASRIERLNQDTYTPRFPSAK